MVENKYKIIWRLILETQITLTTFKNLNIELHILPFADHCNVIYKSHKYFLKQC